MVLLWGSARSPTFYQHPLLRATPSSVRKMSASAALYTSESLKASNAPTFSILKGKLDPGLLQSLQEMNFDFMTPVQSKVMKEMPTMHADWFVLSNLTM